MIYIYYIAVKYNISMSQIGKKIKEAREQKGLMRSFVAEKVGLKDNTLWRIEKNHTKASKPVLKLLEILLDAKFE